MTSYPVLRIRPRGLAVSLAAADKAVGHLPIAPLPPQRSLRRLQGHHALGTVFKRWDPDLPVEEVPQAA
jgi:hypothetical protein